MSLTRELDTALRERATRIPCVEAFGLTIETLDSGTCTLRMRHDRRFDGVGASFHGGLLATAMDCVAWFAIATELGAEETFVTSDLDIRYHRPCQGDVTAIGTVVKIGRTLCTVRCDLHDSENTLIATGSVCYARIIPRDT